ncbi:MAG TPA: glycosyltransferase [Terriglobales bacterium]|nr:glycosyltransferase [Terriglobales bacterium]
MRVLQLGKFYDPFVGGMETVLKEICESLVDQVEFQVIVANTRCRTEHENRKVPVTRVASLGKLFSCSMAPSYPLWARRFDPDLIHVHLPNPLAELFALMADRDIPVVAQFHSDVVRQRNLLKLYGPFLEAFYRRANCIVVPTPRHIEISRFVSKYREKCRVVPFGIPVSRFELDESGRRKADELRDGLPSVLCVGRLVTYKGVEFLIRALEGIKARLRIIGTGPLDGSLRNLAQEKGLADRVEFLGHVSHQDLVAYYHACDVFVLPSITNAEMFGVVQLEAMACRKPVISTNLPTGVSWVNQHGKTGYVVSPGNADELAQSIQHLINNSQLRKEMGEAGRLRVEQHFTSAKMAETMLQVYREMLTEPCRSGAPAALLRAEEEEVVVSPAKCL